MKNFMKVIEKFEMINHGDKIVVGLSGGADSVTLLHALLRVKEQYNLSLVAVHVNHMIRGLEAKRDESFVRDICKSLAVPLEVYQKSVLDIAKLQKISTEEAGRIVRYQCFYDCKKKFNATKIAVAHNLNDSVETMLMNFLRGTGTKGLRGIMPVRDDIIRPLIECKRSDIEDYLHKNGIKYIVDSTNETLDYTRNKVRNMLLPLLMKEFNPNILETLFESTKIFIKEDSFFEEIVAKKKQECVVDGKIAIDKFELLDKAIQPRVLQKIILDTTGDLKGIFNKHLQKIIALKDMETGKKVDLPSGLQASRSYKYIEIKKPAVHKAFSYPLNLGDFIYIREKNFYVSCSSEKVSKENFNNTFTKIFNCDKIKSGMLIRVRQDGDKISNSKKLKQYFIDQKIPREIRDDTALLAFENIVLLVIDQHKKVFSDFLATDDDKKLYIQIWEEL